MWCTVTYFGFLSTEKAVGEGKEAQALLRTQMSALEADRQKASCCKQ